MSMRRVPYVDLAASYRAEAEELLPRIDAALRDGQWVGGPAVSRLEQQLAAELGVESVVALGSGTDALVLAMKALGLGPGDEVITPPNSFVASTAAIVHVGATPVFVEVAADQLLDLDGVEKAIGPRTRAVMPVHLSGRMVDMERVGEIAARHRLSVIEDAAQAIGSKWRGRAAGSFGDVGCFSAHPLKNLSAVGDAGFLATNRRDVAEQVQRLRNHGLEGRDKVVEWGYVSRLDTVQATVLEYRLGRLKEVVATRRRHATHYTQALARVAERVGLRLPVTRPEAFDTFHTFVVQAPRRDALVGWLAERGIGTAIHYATPIHLQPAARSLGYAKGAFPTAEEQATRIVSLPIHQHLSDDDVAYVAQAIEAFFT